MSDAEEISADGTSTVDDLARRVSQLEAKSVQYNDPEMSALRNALEALSGQTVESEDPSSWVQAANAAKDRMEALEAAVDDGQISAAGSEHTLEAMASMPDELVEEKFSMSDQRALQVYRHWDDIAEWVQAGHAISTQRRSSSKHAPAKIRSELNKILDEKLEWTQIYRVMRSVAVLSGSEARVDEDDREHIEGGAFEYHERATPDSKDTYKVLVEADS